MPKQEYFYGLFSFLLESLKGNMMVSEYALVSCILCGSLLTAIYLLLRRSGLFRTYGGNGTSFLFYAVCLLLFFFPMDSPLQQRILIYDTKFNPVANMMHHRFPLPFGMNISAWQLMVVLWLAGSIVFFIRLCIKRRRLHILLESLPKKSVELPPEFMELLPRGTKVYSCCAVSAPFSVGLLRKSVYLPDKSYSEQTVSAILRHEGSHLKRGHHLIALAMELLCVLYWWNPLIYMLRKELERSLELRCDALVLRGCGREEAAEYMEALLSVFQDRNGGLMLRLGMLGNQKDMRSELRERFEAMERSFGGRRGDALRSMVLAALAFAVLIFSTCFVIQPYGLPTENMMLDEELDYQEDTLVPLTEDSRIYHYDDGSYILVNMTGEYDVSSWVDVLINEGMEPVERAGQETFKDHIVIDP